MEGERSGSCGQDVAQGQLPRQGYVGHDSARFLLPAHLLKSGEGVGFVFCTC